MKFPHLAAQIFNTPLLIHPGKLDALIAGLGGRLLGVPAGAVAHVGAVAAEQSGPAPEMFSTRRGERADRGYRVVDGVAVIGINGVLVHRTRFEMAESAFFYGYNDLAADLEDAMNNPEVHAVLQVFDSPGGEAQGAFEYARRVHDMRGKKPLWAIADGMAASAAYLGGSAAEMIAVTDTGYAGSIGVVARHVDFSRALDADGITVTHVFAGAHKVDGNPYEPLPAAVRKDWQAEIDGLYTMFVDAVANHRGLEAKAIRATEARTFVGHAAVSAGLADRIATTDALITELAAKRDRSFSAGPTARTNANQGASMSGTTQGGQQAATTAAPVQGAQFSQADLDAARAEGAKQGAQAERERAAAILGHEAAKGRTELAQQCVSTGLTVEQSAAILAAAPKAAPQAATQGGAFAQHMAALGNPPTSGVEAPSADAASPAAVQASWDAAFGIAH